MAHLLRSLAWVSLPSRERGLKPNEDCALDGIFQSLPSRERGLKLIEPYSRVIIHSSLPSRERGLKPEIAAAFLEAKGSLPSRERGLKPVLPRGLGLRGGVAPFAGAWVETIFDPRRMIWTYRRSLRGSVG